jgi:hypothetical protein
MEASAFTKAAEEEREVVVVVPLADPAEPMDKRAALAYTSRPRTLKLVATPAVVVTRVSPLLCEAVGGDGHIGDHRHGE